MTQLEDAIVDSSELRPRTKELYLQHVRAFLAFVSDKPGRKFTGKNVKAWKVNMRLRQISPESVNVALNALRYAAENAQMTALAKAASDFRVRVPKTRAEPKPEPLSWDEGRRLIAACDGDRGRDLRDRAIITLGLRTGMLRFSMCQLKLSDLKSFNLTFVKKGGESHTIMLDDVTMGALEDWISWLDTHRVRRGFMFRSLGRQRVDPNDGAAIGDQLTPDGLYRALRERARKAGLDDLHPYVFRKTFLAWAKLAGARPGQIAAVTGHKSDAAGDEAGVTTPPANMLLPAWKDKF